MPERAPPDRALGVFETLLVLDGAPIELDAHLARLSASVRELFGVAAPARLADLARERAATLELGRLRLTVSPAAARVPGVEAPLAVELVSGELDEAVLFPSWEAAVVLCPLEIAGGLGAHKWADRRRLALGPPTGDDRLALVLDADEQVLEASRANVFAVEQGVLTTPPADGRILPGVARERTLDAARALGVRARVEPIGLERLLAAGEAFVTGSLRGVEPVRSIGGVSLREPGEAARAVAAELRRAWNVSRAVFAT